jgi:hypothetical protein
MPGGQLQASFDYSQNIGSFNKSSSAYDKKDSTQKDDLERSKSNTNNFFDSVKIFAYKSFITRKIYDYVVLPPQTDNNQEALNYRNEIKYSIYDGLIIRTIDVFPLRDKYKILKDTSVRMNKIVNDLGDNIYSSTNRRVIKKNMLLNKGDTISGLILADNERLLRQLPYIEDVNTQVLLVPNTDSVDIVLMVDDVWPVEAGININDIESGNVKFMHNNLGGWGHEFGLSFPFDNNKTPFLGYSGKYLIRNVVGYHFNTSFSFEDVFNDQRWQVNIQRPFFSPNTKYAGGARYFQRSAYFIGSETNIEKPLDYHMYDFWVGRAFLLNQSNKNKRRLRFMTSGRYLNYQFENRPVVSDTNFYNYHQRTYYLATLGISKQWFYESNFMYNYRKTEDIPCGTLFEITTGYEFNEFFNRPYTAASIYLGDFQARLGYGSFKINIGGFWERSRFKQGIFSIESRYFSNPIKIKGFLLRPFIRMNYKKGINQLSDEHLSNNGEYRIEGLKSNFFIGDEKIFGSTEWVVFMPYYFYGFRFVAFAGADMVIVAKEHERLFDQDLFSSINIGLRIKNERLALKAIQIKMSYFPVIPQKGPVRFIEITGVQQLNFEKFRISLPKILSFN